MNSNSDQNKDSVWIGIKTQLRIVEVFNQAEYNWFYKHIAYYYSKEVRWFTRFPSIKWELDMQMSQLLIGGAGIYLICNEEAISI